LCVNKVTAEEREELDLSSWRVAFCGAEPIHSETLSAFAEMFAPYGFSPEAFYPCYGLAEATLLASGGRSGPAKPIVKRVLRSGLGEHRVELANGHTGRDVQELVGCGGALCDLEIAIVDTKTLEKVPDDRVGEIWIKGKSVADGYWNRPEESERTFGARLNGSSGGDYLRTGDLGFISDGELFVTGRVKDVIIIRGSNHYPQDIEHTVSRSHPALEQVAGAAFSIEADGQERLVAVHELNRQHRDADLAQVFRHVRSAISSEHELDMHAIVLIRQASMPRTTSGKIQRNLCRQRFLDGELNVVGQWVRNGHGKSGVNGKAHDNGNGRNGTTNGNRPHAGMNGAHSKDARPNGKSSKPLFDPSELPLAADEIDRLAERIEAWMARWLVEHAGLPAEDLDRETPFAELGIDSLTAVELSQELEDWLHVKLTPVVAWNYPTPRSLARYLAREAGGANDREAELEAEGEQSAESDFERMLAEIESLSEDEAASAVDQTGGDLR